MGKKSKPKAPETPDYIGAARTQGEEDRRTAQEIADMSRINQYNPMGAQEWSQDASGRWSMTQSLSPEQQQLFNNAQTLNLGIGDAAIGSLGQYQDMMGAPLDFSGLGDMASVSPYGLNTDVQSAQFGEGLNLEGMSAMPAAGDYGAERQEVIDAYYRQGARNLDPQFQQQEENMRARLLNSGVREGTEAWQRAWDDFSRSRTGAYGDLTDRSIIGGGREQSRMLADTLGIRQQDFGERMGTAQQRDAETLNRLNAQLAELGFENQAYGQQFGQDVTAANMDNMNRNQALQEMLMQRQIPQQELAALINAAGSYGLPTYGSGQQNVPQYSAPDILGATQAGFNADLGKYNADMAGRNAKKGSTTGLAGTLGGAAILASDERLKQNIEPIGKIGGHNFYVWDWNDKAKSYGVANQPRVGVMAQEIAETHPDAVVEMRDGYLAVDYGKIWENE